MCDAILERNASFFFLKLLLYIMFCYVSFKDKCQSLTRLIVTVADDSSKLLLSSTLGEEPCRQLSFNLINLVLVRELI